MTFFCPVCWKEIKGNDKICPHCGADISEHENKGFEEKLINALTHPERETVQRAVYILGRLKSVKAVKHLFVLFKQTDNTFLKLEVLNTLNEIGVPEAREFLMKAIDSDVGIIKRMAKELINSGEIYKAS
ncbi:MAG: HEAT repeat domain-containing protein [Planctomycetes bacterium]|nr:HEAT repeat domain-containing protein [Planctomycetota bacterium]